MSSPEAKALTAVADVLASSHRWLNREADLMRDDNSPLGGDGWTSLHVEDEQLAICLHNMERTVAFLRDLAGGGGAE